MSYFRPASTDELLELLARHPEARILAGATDVVPQGRKAGRMPPVLVDPGLLRDRYQGIRDEGGRLWIGAFTPFQDLVDSSRMNREYPVLVEAARWIGSRQIRNMATVGGNIANASPAGDSMPALLVYEAALRLQGSTGCREIPLSEFYLAYKKTDLRPGEFIEAVLIPPPPAARKAYYRKAGPRRVLSISRTAVAGLALGTAERPDGYRLAAAGVAPIPVRLRHVEAFLGTDGAPDGPPTQQTYPLAEALRRDIAPIDDIRATAEYKFRVTLNLILELLEES